MIAKKIKRTAGGGYRRLAEYIAAAKDPGEKLDDLWIVGAQAGENIESLDFAIREIEATQALNTTARGDKNYHLMVSFRDEKPSKEALRDIERQFAAALGFAEHPRVAATHRDTDNFHLHIAFCRVHPKTGRAHTPHRDFKTLEKVCREMEKKHALKTDLGREDKLKADLKPEAARNMEAHSWEQSFFSYVRERKKPLLKALGKAKGWGDLHDAFAKYDLVLKKRGNGLIIASGDRNHHIKASALDRAFSKAALEKRLGPFQAREKNKTARPTRRYAKKPITRHPGQARLWKAFMSGPPARSKTPGLMSRTWKAFLLYQALEDPLAMAIVYYQKKLLEAVLAPPAAKRTPTKKLS